MRLVNKFVLVIFGLLLIYTATSIFHPSDTATLTDVAVRSVAFSVFGYIISSFVNRHLVEADPKTAEKEVKQQQWVVFITCIISLGILSCIKYLSFERAENYLSLALIKHIFCGSAGFLIGLQKIPDESKNV